MKKKAHLADQFDLFIPPQGSAIHPTVKKFKGSEKCESIPHHVSKQLSSSDDRRMSGPPDRYQLYTDGSCAHNPGGAGGWCAILLIEGLRIKTVSGHTPSTTNNKMELKAIVEGLKLIKEGESVDVWTDSKYAQLGANVWIESWVKNHWRTGRAGNGSPIKNDSLWRQLWELKRTRFCEFFWVKGHNGDKWNEECDRIAEERASDKVEFRLESAGG